MPPDAMPAPQRREHPEPTERHRPVPRALWMLAAAMTALGVAYIATDAPSSAPALGDQRVLAELRARPQQAGSAAAADGAALYAARCAACHQPSGSGVPGVFPPLAGSEWLTGPERRLAALVLNGVTGPITVKGHSYSGAMPAFASQLNDAELAALLTQLRAQWGAGAAAVTPATVARVRQDTQGRTEPFDGEAELKAFE